jgi:hypothetical protein
VVEFEGEEEAGEGMTGLSGFVGLRAEDATLPIGGCKGDDSWGEGEGEGVDGGIEVDIDGVGVFLVVMLEDLGGVGANGLIDCGG